MRRAVAVRFACRPVGRPGVRVSGAIVTLRETIVSDGSAVRAGAAIVAVMSVASRARCAFALLLLGMRKLMCGVRAASTGRPRTAPHDKAEASCDRVA